MISGNIPEKITLLTRSPEKKGDTEVIPTFVADSTNKATLETGRNWMSQHHWNGNKSVKTKGVEHPSRENSSRRGYRILNLEVRSEGGRAYKVVSDEGFYVDLREDVLLDTIKEVGIAPGGVLNGKFLFATVGSQMKLIREGSELHKELIEITTLKKQPKLSAKALEVGGVYSTSGGKVFIFGGHVDTQEIKVTTDYKSSWQAQYNYSTPKPIKNAQLWISIWLSDGDYQKQLDDMLKTDGHPQYHAEVIKNKAILGKIGSIKVIDFITAFREGTEKVCGKRDNGNLVVNGQVLKGYEDYDKAYHSKILNMVPAKP